MDSNELADKVAYSCNILAQQGHWDNILGHVSVRIPGEDTILMKPNGFGLEEIRPQHLIVCDLEGQKVRGEYERHSEVFIHTEIFKTRPDINCVIHTHPIYATVFGSLGQRLRPISHEGALFAEDLPVFDYTSALIITAELGQKLAGTMGTARATLMKNHGVTVAGGSVEEATLYAIFLEKAAKVQLLASASGEPSWSSDEEARLKIQQMYTPQRLTTLWAYFVRLAQKARTDTTP